MELAALIPAHSCAEHTAKTNNTHCCVVLPVPPPPHAHAGVSTLNPDSFFHAKQSLVLALTQLHAAFKSSTPALASALAHAKAEIEDIGLFE